MSLEPRAKTPLVLLGTRRSLFASLAPKLITWPPNHVSTPAFELLVCVSTRAACSPAVGSMQLVDAAFLSATATIDSAGPLSTIGALWWEAARTFAPNRGIED